MNIILIVGVVIHDVIIQVETPGVLDFEVYITKDGGSFYVRYAHSLSLMYVMVSKVYFTIISELTFCSVACYVDKMYRF